MSIVRRAVRTAPGPKRHRMTPAKGTHDLWTFDIVCRRGATAAILGATLALASCAGDGRARLEGLPILAESEKAAVARSLANVAPGDTAPWTEIRTDAVGTAKIVGEAAGDCLPVEVMRLREDRFDTLRIALCADGQPRFR